MKESTIDQLTHRQLLLVLTYAPAGLGHLRIMDALYHGLPETVNPVDDDLEEDDLILQACASRLSKITRFPAAELVRIKPVLEVVLVAERRAPATLPGAGMFTFHSPMVLSPGG